MTRAGRAIPFFRSVRAKLLVMLALLSLPLLIISLIQLNNYRHNLDDQAATIARIETSAAAGALTNWLEDHLSFVTPTGGAGARSEAEAATAAPA